jgi:hypothetical protein
VTMQDNDRTALPSHAPILDDDEELEGIIAPDPVLVFEVSLNGEDLDLIEPAAIAAGLSVTRYLKHAALQESSRQRGQSSPAAD